MKAEVVSEKEMKQLMSGKKNRVVKKAATNLTLDQIETKMIELATDESTDLVVQMINEKKIAMLEKVANLKLHRLQLRELEKSGENIPVEVKPLEVRFVSSKTQEQKLRLERIDDEITHKQTKNA